MEWTRIVLVRHGETEWNQENRWQGSRGTPLSARGRRQCQAAAEALADAGIGVVYASDLERARQSAEIIAGRLGLPVRFDVNLRERDVGQWEGLTDEEVSERFPEDHVRHLAHPGTFAATGGESREEVFARVVEFIERLVADHAGEAVLVVAHAGPVKSALCHALRAPVHSWRNVDVDNGSISIIEGQPGRLRVARVNDTHHLQGL